MVCAANVCRSPMAEIVATEIVRRKGLSGKFYFESAGTHASKNKMRIDTRAVAALERRGYKVKRKRSRPIESKDFERFDFIFAMDNTNYNELLRFCPLKLQYKLRMFLAESTEVNVKEIPDPYYGNNEGFERVLNLCEAGVQIFLDSTIL